MKYLVGVIDGEFYEYDSKELAAQVVHDMMVDGFGSEQIAVYESRPIGFTVSDVKID